MQYQTVDEESILLVFLLQTVFSFAQDFKTPYEKGNGNQTTTYEEMVKFYEDLDKNFESISVVEKGKDDNGEPIKVVIFDHSKKQNTSVIFINNGIHPGESDGIDATMMLMRDLALGKIKVPQNTKVAAIEAYNISGMQRRGKFSRANQNGPEEYGFRGNARNFDLNRDWAWQTQLETQQRIKKYHEWMPQVHVDYHEQGFNEPYYFAPAAEPLHEVITPWQRDFQVMIGRNHAKYFDQNNWLFFTKERFDLLYPSYGDTYPVYNGAIGMTYERVVLS